MPSTDQQQYDFGFLSRGFPSVGPGGAASLPYHGFSGNSGSFHYVTIPAPNGFP